MITDRGQANPDRHPSAYVLMLRRDYRALREAGFDSARVLAVKASSGDQGLAAGLANIRERLEAEALGAALADLRHKIGRAS